MTGKPMSRQIQERQAERVQEIERMIAKLHHFDNPAFDDGSDDLAVAAARLENWLTENKGRWTT